MYPPQPYLENREGVRFTNLTACYTVGENRPLLKFKGGADRRKGTICLQITILLMIPDTHTIYFPYIQRIDVPGFHYVQLRGSLYHHTKGFIRQRG